VASTGAAGIAMSVRSRLLSATHVVDAAARIDKCSVKPGSGLKYAWLSTDKVAVTMTLRVYDV
jgi:hypothetical protein